MTPRDGPTELALFAHALRAADIPVSTADLAVAGDALRRLGPATSDRRYWALRATLRIPPNKIATFDDLHATWVHGHAAPPTDPPDVQTQQTGPQACDDDARHDDGQDGPVWSLRERLRDVRLEDMDARQLDVVDELLDRLWQQLRRRPARRRRPAAHGRELDLLATVRAARRLAGEPLVLHHRQRRTVPRRLVLLIDASGSMAPLTRPLLHLAHLARQADPRTETFVFGTQLTRLTPQLDPRRPFDHHRLATHPRDWGGGTRTGTALTDLRTRWAPRGILRGATVLIASDGLDGGDVEQLSREIAHLARHVDRVLWASPLVGGPGYQPVQRALQAALPHVDELLSIRTFADLEATLDRLHERQPVRDAHA